MQQETTAWWQGSVHQSDLGRISWLAQFDAAFDAIVRIGAHHAVVTMVGQGAYEQVRSLTASLGREGLEQTLVTSFDTEETHAVSDLWAVARNRLDLHEFIARHGYHGPAEGELASHSWRTDSRPLDQLIQTYQGMSEAMSPDTLRSTRAAERATAERQFFAALPLAKRPPARALIGIAREYKSLRELGRATFLKAFDVARTAGWEMGKALCRESTLQDPEDIFYLSFDEVKSLPLNAGELVKERRQQRVEYTRLELPERWQGSARPTPILEASGPTVVSGLGASKGVVEGRVRVVLNLAESEPIQPGEILVCETTDPSWASYFLIAGGVVIDVGGILSHGAIVARELGIPCVINARNATRQLRTGDLVRIDGMKGTVDVIATSELVTDDPAQK
jgi:pyruvate,water dikinase